MTPLDDTLRARIGEILSQNSVVLFMKGSRQQPMCGFSAAAVGVLDGLLGDYATVDVLEDDDIRQGIKAYGSWPTIPQLYIGGELIGGSDVIRELYNRGELHERLGLEAPDRTPPEISVAEDAAGALAQAIAGQAGLALRLDIDPRFQTTLTLAQPEGHEICAEIGDLRIYMDLGTAQRAAGVRIEAVETPEGTAFRIDNPNAPQQIQSMSVSELKSLMETGGDFHLFDVRTPGEREIAAVPDSRLLDRETIAFIEQLPKDVLLLFICHTGNRSRAAAEHFAAQGYVNVHNVVGGIDAWSNEIDPSVPRY